jgi:hypothetical protein
LCNSGLISEEYGVGWSSPNCSSARRQWSLVSVVELTSCIWFLLFELTKFAMMATCDVGGSCESHMCARFRNFLKLVLVLVVTSVVVDVSV